MAQRELTDTLRLFSIGGMNPNQIDEIVAKFCRAPDAIKLSGLPETTFYRYVEQGRIPCYRLTKSIRSRLFKIDEVLKAVEVRDERKRPKRIIP